ncbi:type II toxin-antitoxin system VapB family antitoxin [Methylobrevis pamukkalensis]|uniref:Transcription factor n=1 Tax=Methylobrevis pamukkalensis TaxID=1439726 RepID=A0A1E3H2X9_9HYPH|nr:type II toxin-antitoxin system VapB family antitoxin [Methylobrevis pamukkalensis]ODN70505.1 transcription factor [Methylobrevis pamukkalensis]
MALYIRDQTVDDLATELQRLTRAKTKTEAVRRALEKEIALVKQAPPLADKVATALARADALGASDPSFDMKTFTDEMWGNV